MKAHLGRKEWISHFALLQHDVIYFNLSFVIFFNDFAVTDTKDNLGCVIYDYVRIFIEYLFILSK